jgi:guanine deaminase
MKNAQEELMRKAIQLSVDNVKLGKGGPFAAIVVKDGKIISHGTNLVTSTNDPTAHAEVVAIREACKTLHSFQLDGCEIYTSCEPCPMCLGAIYWARPSRVYYAGTRSDAARVGFDDSFIYDELKKPITEYKIPMIPLLNNEALAAFNVWKEKEDKQKY